MNHPASDIRRQAARLLDSAGISHEPVSLRDVVSALNLELVKRTREPFTSEAALEPLGDGRAIVLNGSGDSGRRRFTIAHEIGHFVLHPERCRPERGGVVNEAGRMEEREADAFAAELLMPENLVRDAIREQGLDVDRLADRFEVSRKAMQARLRNLGLTERHSEL
jgi:predicted transcriptional regulator